jgi:hypothetical protein
MGDLEEGGRPQPFAGASYPRGVSPNANRFDQVVSRRLPDGPRQAWHLGQVSAAGTRCGVSDGRQNIAYALARSAMLKKPRCFSAAPGMPMAALLELVEQGLGEPRNSSAGAMPSWKIWVASTVLQGVLAEDRPLSPKL